VLLEEALEETVHGFGPTEHVDSVGVVQGADALEHFVVDPALQELPALGRVAEDVVHLDATHSLLQLLPQHDVVLSSVGEEEDEVDGLVLHARDLHHRLEQRRDSAATSDHEDAVAVVLLMLCIWSKLLMKTLPPGW
jgi:hypothetical protein